MRSYKTRLDTIERRIPKDMKVACCFSHEDKDGIYSDPACTEPLADDSDFYNEDKYTVKIHWVTVDGGKK